MPASGSSSPRLLRVVAAALLAHAGAAAGHAEDESVETIAQGLASLGKQAGPLQKLQDLPLVPTSKEELERLPRPWAAFLVGVAALFVCQIGAIGYIQCFKRARHEGRAFWYRGSPRYVVEQVHCCSNEPPNLSPVKTGELQHDLRNGRAYWSGNWGRDYRFHVANFHPLISVFACHPVHPFGKVARAIVLAITLAFMVGWRRFVQEEVMHLPGNLDQDISGGMKDASKVVPQLQDVSVNGRLVLFFYVTLPSMIAELFFGKLAMLHDSVSDFHREYSGRTCCTVFVSWFIILVGWMACLLFYVLACASLGFLVYSVYTLRAHLKLGQGTQELYYFVVLMPQTLAQIWFIWWFVADLFMPVFGFGLCHACQIIPGLRLFCWQWWVEEEMMVQEPTWRVADTAHRYFGVEVHDDLFGENTAILREEAGLVHDSTEKKWVAVERVANKDVEAWVNSKMSGAKRGEALLTEVEERRAHSLRLQENECVELLPCCMGGGGSPQARGGFGLVESFPSA